MTRKSWVENFGKKISGRKFRDENFEKFQILEYGLETEWPSDAKVLERDWANVLEHLWSIIKDTVTKLTKLKDGLKDIRPGNFITAK